LLEAFVALLQLQTLKSIAHKKTTTKIGAAKVSNPTTTCTLDQGVFLFLIGSKAQELGSRTGVQNWGSKWGPELAT
jgi:hypothetical protein